MIAGMLGVLDKLDPKPESAEGEKAGAEGEGEGRASLAEMIETRKFLGPEFLTWLWFESEIFEQTLTISNLGEVELWLEKQITFQALTESGVEKAALSGMAPSGGEEAKEALRQGKMPIKAKLGVRLSDTEAFSFVFEAPTFALSGVKIPALLKGEGDDPFCERMTLIEKIEGVVELLFRDFLSYRLGLDWGKHVVPCMRAWMRGEEAAELVWYRAQRAPEPEAAS